MDGNKERREGRKESIEGEKGTEGARIKGNRIKW